MSESVKLSRRSVSLAALASVGCFAGLDRPALASAIAAARVSGKPVLTEATLNAAIPRPGQRGYARELQAASKNLARYLSDRFELTEQQKRQIATIDQKELRGLADLLKKAQARSDGVVVKMTAGANDAGKFSKVTAGVEEIQLNMKPGM